MYIIVFLYKGCGSQCILQDSNSSDGKMKITSHAQILLLLLFLLLFDIDKLINMCEMHVLNMCMHVYA